MDTEVETDWLREEEEEDKPVLWEGDEGWTLLPCEERLEEGKTLVGPWTKSQKSSLSSEKTALGALDGGWTWWAWVEKPKAEEVHVEEGVGKEVGASKGPWKALKPSLSSHKVGEREWVETEGCDVDDSAKMRNNDDGTHTHTLTVEKDQRDSHY